MRQTVCDHLPSVAETELSLPKIDCDSFLYGELSSGNYIIYCHGRHVYGKFSETEPHYKKLLFAPSTAPGRVDLEEFPDFQELPYACEKTGGIHASGFN